MTKMFACRRLRESQVIWSNLDSIILYHQQLCKQNFLSWFAERYICISVSLKTDLKFNVYCAKICIFGLLALMPKHLHWHFGCYKQVLTSYLCICFFFFAYSHVSSRRVAWQNQHGVKHKVCPLHSLLDFSLQKLSKQ